MEYLLHIFQETTAKRLMFHIRPEDVQQFGELLKPGEIAYNNNDLVMWITSSLPDDDLRSLEAERKIENKLIL